MRSDFDAALALVRGHVHVHVGRLPSAVLGVADATGILALEAFGSAAGRTTRVDDHFYLFSVTKPLVGLTLARAIERGELSALTPLAAAAPAFADRPVQLRHLVSHTSGITESPLDTLRGLDAELESAGSDFSPGTASRYSSIAFHGAAALHRHSTGRSWDDALVGWAHAAGASGITLDPASDPHPVIDATEAGLNLDAFTRLAHPGAGLLGRAGDLLTIGSALLRDDGEIVRPATAEMMRRPLTGDIPRLEPYSAERGQDWGFTWNLRTRAPGLIDQNTYGHGGWAGTEFWVHPSARLVWVLMTHRVRRPGVDADLIDNAVVSAR